MSSQAKIESKVVKNSVFELCGVIGWNLHYVFSHFSKKIVNIHYLFCDFWAFFSGAVQPRWKVLAQVAKNSGSAAQILKSGEGVKILDIKMKQDTYGYVAQPFGLGRMICFRGQLRQCC